MYISYRKSPVAQNFEAISSASNGLHLPTTGLREPVGSMAIPRPSCALAIIQSCSIHAGFLVKMKTMQTGVESRQAPYVSTQACVYDDIQLPQPRLVPLLHCHDQKEDKKRNPKGKIRMTRRLGHHLPSCLQTFRSLVVTEIWVGRGDIVCLCLLTPFHPVEGSKNTFKLQALFRVQVDFSR